MGDHDSPGSWLDRWRQQEPLRLYLWSTASAVLVAGVVAGWWTQELSLAIAGPVAAALMVGSTAAARSVAYAPATVERLEQGWQLHEDEAVADAAEAQHAVSWQDGWEAGVEAARLAAEETARSPEKVAGELRPPDPPGTALLAAQGPCTYTEGGARCTLPRHPEGFPHRLEAVGPQE